LIVNLCLNLLINLLSNFLSLLLLSLAYFGRCSFLISTSALCSLIFLFKLLSLSINFSICLPESLPYFLVALLLRGSFLLLLFSFLFGILKLLFLTFFFVLIEGLAVHHSSFIFNLFRSLLQKFFLIFGLQHVYGRL
jgi:hypothetical protein